MILKHYDLILDEVNLERKLSANRKTRGGLPAHVEAAERLKEHYPRHLKGAPVTVANILSAKRKAGFGRPENYGVRRRIKPP
jgi:hypothetical protein